MPARNRRVFRVRRVAVYGRGYSCAEASVVSPCHPTVRRRWGGVCLGWHGRFGRVLPVQSLAAA